MGKASRQKQERRSAKEAVRQKTRSRSLFVPITVVAVLVGVIVITILAVTRPEEEDVQPPAGTEKFDPETLSREHVDDASFEEDMPVGGSHESVWLNCGAYGEPQETGLIVHSMEHGAVWVGYGDGLSDEDREKLESLVDLDPYVVVAPNPDLEQDEVVASAWGYRLKAEGASDPHLEEFVTEFARGPQTPEAGATCEGGEGNPDRTG